MNDTQLFHCPSCGGPLDLKEDLPTIRCEYCNSSIIVPASLRRGPVKMDLTSAEASFLTPVEIGNLRLLIANDRKIDAIKRLRQLTDLGLKDAKEIADALERGEPVGRVPARRPAEPLDASDIRFQQIRNLALQDQAMEAVRLMRETADVSLHDARILVESMRQGESTAYILQMLQDMQEAYYTGGSGAPQPVEISITPLDAGTARKTAATVGAGISCGVVGFIVFILAVTILPILFALTTDGGPLAPLWSKVNPVGFAAVDLTVKAVGIAPGAFNDPRTVAVDADGNIYAADFSSGRLQSLHAQGEPRWLVNLGDETIVQSLDVSPGGVLYVVSMGNIRRFQLNDGKELEPFPNPGDEFYFEDLFFAPDGRMAVIADSEDLSVYDADSHLLFQVRAAVSSITHDSELDCDVALDALGNIFLLGHFNNKVLKYSSDGRYVNQFGGETTDETPGKFRAPGEIAIDPQGRVYVSDIFGIQVFDGDGQYLEHFKYSNYAFGMDFDAANRMYIASNEPQVLRLELRK